MFVQWQITLKKPDNHGVSLVVAEGLDMEVHCQGEGFTSIRWVDRVYVTTALMDQLA